MPYRIGLTGGIGSGKSVATAIFHELGAAIVDTDQISHELTAPAGAAIAAIADRFGACYLAPDGSLDRGKMRRLVFSDPQSKRALEAILHPLIRETAKRQIAAVSQPYVLVVVPLLLETGAYSDMIDRVLVVDCDENLQIARAMKRSQLTADEVGVILAAQSSRKQRLALADDVLRNDSDIASLRHQIEALHAKYVSLARPS